VCKVRGVKVLSRKTLSGLKPNVRAPS